jgi:hypothetical protein
MNMAPVGIHDMVDGIDAAEKALRAAQAGRLEAVWTLMTAADTDHSSPAYESVHAEVSCVLHVSARSAGHLMDDAETICTRPDLLAALADGRIDLARAKTIAGLLDTTDLQNTLQAAAIAYATNHTPYETRRWLLSRLPDTGTELDRADEHAKRCIEVNPGRHGMSHLYGYLPTDVAETLHATLTSIARNHKTPDDDRTADQRRADAVAELLHHRTDITTTVALVVPATGRGATLNGTPIPWAHAWTLACTTDPWTAWLTTPDGRVLDTTPTRYRIPTRLARAVRARDQHCRFPGCHTPAARCDLDHLTPYPAGPTTYANLHCLCRRHHRLKHTTGWTVTPLGDNHLQWTSPAGRIYHTRPPNTLDYAA